MTWEIAVGIFALVGFVISIATITGKQAGVLARLETTLKALNNTLEELKKSNKESHKDIYDKIADHEKRVGDMETKMQIYHDK